MQRSKTTASHLQTTFYSPRVSLILSAVLTMGAGVTTAYTVTQCAAIPDMAASVWLRGQAVLWLLWTCLWGFHWGLAALAWRTSLREGTYFPPIGMMSLTWKRFLWQSLLMMAIIATEQTYRISHSPGQSTHATGILSQSIGYACLLSLLGWTTALALQPQKKKVDSN